MGAKQSNPSFAGLVRAGLAQALREQLLRACDESFLQRRVAQLARKYRIMDVRVNAHLRETSYMLERFLDTLLQHEDSLPGESTGRIIW